MFVSRRSFFMVTTLSHQVVLADRLPKTNSAEKFTCFRLDV
jgi:hypothetical protein